jgi:hypothetical protein
MILNLDSVHRPSGKSGELPVPWEEIISNPSKFYDNQKFALPVHLLPHNMSIGVT